MHESGLMIHGTYRTQFNVRATEAEVAMPRVSVLDIDDYVLNT